MAQEIINVGAAPNDGDGDPIRTAFIKSNNNFGELYSRAQVAPPASLIGQVGDFAGMYAYDPSFFYYCFADYDGSSIIWAQVTQVGNVSVSSISSGNSSVAFDDLDGNVNVEINGVANVAIINGSGLLVNGLANISGNVTSANVFTAGQISATGNITGSYVLGNGSQLTGLPETYANANVAAYLPTYTGNLAGALISVVGNVTGGNARISSTISAGGNIIGNNVSAGIVTANTVNTSVLDSSDSSPISVVPIMSFQSDIEVDNDIYANNNLYVSANVESGNIFNTGAITSLGNIETTGYFIGTFFGNITGNFVVPGANTEIIFNTNGNADAASGLTYNTTGNVLSVLGVISATGNINGGNLRTAGIVTATGNIQGGNLRTAGIVTATGNVTGGNLTTAGLVLATGNVTGGNLTTAGLVLATNVVATTISGSGNVTGSNLLTGGSITATANISGGNIRTSGIVTATGNITGANVDTTGRVIATGNVIGGNIITGGAISAVGGIVAASLSSTGNITGGNITGGNIFTAGQVSATGNITGSYIIGNGSQLTGLPASYANANVAAYLPTYTGNLAGGNLSVTNNISGNVISASGNITGANLLTAGLISATGNVTGNFIFGNGSQLTGIDATSIQSGTSNVRVVSSGGNVATGVGGTANVVVVATTGQFVTGLISATGAITAGGDLSLIGNIVDTGPISIITSSNGNINLAPNGTGNINIGGNVMPTANATANIGSAALSFNTIFARATSAQYADLAEKYTADKDYEPGTVLCFGGTAELTQCDTDSCVKVAGVVSTNPAYCMNSGLESAHVVSVALVGRVPCKVKGPVFRGSMMVSAGDGHARAEINPPMGAVIGKSLQDFDGDTGIVEIVVGRL